ncbi:beta strand repeat-containing protein [Haloferula sp.]|uniref:beta strand repeat-containing protein n=1 Tax=Haloferula sp. TaxID=2497595 RepID=UPI00329CF2CE
MKQPQKQLFALLALAISNCAFASTYTWTDGGGNENWPNNGNWSGASGSPNSSDDIAQLHGSFSNNSSKFDVDLTAGSSPSDGSIEIESLRVSTDNAADTWTLGPGSHPTPLLIIYKELGVALSGGSFTCSADIELGDDEVAVGVKGGTATISGELIGGASSTLDLDSGAVVVGDGTSGITGGTLRLSASNNDSFTGTIDVGKTLLDLNSTTGLRNATVNLVNINNRFTYNDNALLGELTGTHNISLANRLRVGNNDSNHTFGGRLDGNGTLTKVGSGVWTLSNTGNNTGSTVISSGEIRLNHADALQSSPLSIDTANGLDITTNSIDANLHSLDGSGRLFIGNQTLTLGGNLSSNVTYDGELADDQNFGTVVINTSGSGKQILTANNSNLFSEFKLLSGTLQINDNTQLGSPNTALTFGNGHLLAVAPSSFTLDKIVGFEESDSHAQVTVFSSISTLTFPRTLQGGTDNILEILSGGTVAFSSTSSSYPGTVRVNGGSLSLGGGSSFSGASIDLLSDDDLILPDTDIGLGSISGSGNFSIGTSNTLTVGFDDRTTSYTGIISGNGSSQLEKTGSGTFTFGGSTTTTQPIILQEGVLVLDGTTATSLATGVEGNSNTSVEGTGRVSGALDLDGNISPSNPGVDNYGILRAGGIYTNDTYHCDVTDSDQDLLITSGVFDATNCSLTLNLLGGTLTQAAYIICDYGSLTGTFSAINNLPTGYNIDYSYHDGSDSNNIAIVADSTAPTVSITTTEPSPTNANSVAYSIAFDEPITGLINSSDLYITGTTTATTDIASTVITNSGDDQNFTLTLNNISGEGFLQFRLRANQIADLAGNNLASDPFSPGRTIDNTAPIITVTGSTNITQTIGSSYDDAGAGATDNVDASVTVITGGDTVDTNTAGTYVITYDATDAAGNAATQQSRTVLIQTHIVSWLDSYGLTGDDALLTADPDGDGRDNLEEFAFDGDPTNGSDTNKITYGFESGEGEILFSITIPARDGARFFGPSPATATIDGIVYTIRGSFDLVTFNANLQIDSRPNASGLAPLNAGWSYQRFFLSSPVPGGRGFLKVEIEEEP